MPYYEGVIHLGYILWNIAGNLPYVFFCVVPYVIRDVKTNLVAGVGRGGRASLLQRHSHLQPASWSQGLESWTRW